MLDIQTGHPMERHPKSN